MLPLRQQNSLCPRVLAHNKSAALRRRLGNRSLKTETADSAVGRQRPCGERAPPEGTPSPRIRKATEKSLFAFRLYPNGERSTGVPSDKVLGWKHPEGRSNG